MQLGFLPILALIFITLRLTQYIDWSWWYVLMPLWGPFALVTAYFMGKLIVVLIQLIMVGATSKKIERKKPDATL